MELMQSRQYTRMTFISDSRLYWVNCDKRHDRDSWLQQNKSYCRKRSRRVQHLFQVRVHDQLKVITYYVIKEVDRTEERSRAGQILIYLHSVVMNMKSENKELKSKVVGEEIYRRSFMWIIVITCWVNSLDSRAVITELSFSFSSLLNSINSRPTFKQLKIRQVN